MYTQSRKRKHRNRSTHGHDNDHQFMGDVGRYSPDPALFIQAHEADLIRGPQALLAAQSLEAACIDEKGVCVGDGLIRWKENTREVSDFIEDEHVQLGQPQSKPLLEDKEENVWVDRYDARLLLDTLPIIQANRARLEPNSPTGWSDLPSDAEDTFFFSPDETEDYRRDKRRKLIDKGREERLKAMGEESGDEDRDKQEEEWGGSDEEPDNTQKELMRRTASHILTSPNPAQLEMRILANHGADRRFAFLKGRWSRTWRILKGHARMEMAKEKSEKPFLASLGGLAGYGDSDEEGSVESEGNKGCHELNNPLARAVNSGEQARSDKDVEQGKEDDEVKKARRARAREWAEKRRILQSTTVDEAGM
ncbi:hypothetical protein AcV5_001555 [Taiwanofungus camphoratus]|nr:hypothetical protein AcV5_001555 [Antrodia cinnamomea]